MNTACFTKRHGLGVLLTILGFGLSFALAAQTHRAREISFEPPAQPVSGDGNALPVVTGDAVYGTTQRGGRYGWGTLYRVGRDGLMQVLHDFGPADAEPADLTLGDDRALYGVTRFGGRSDGGTLFRYDLDGSYQTIADFVSRTGRFPNSLRRGRDGVLYGTTVDAGAHRWGTIFRLNPQRQIEVLHALEVYGRPTGAPLLASDGRLYGVLESGAGRLNGGAVYRLDFEGRFDLMFEFGNPPMTDAEGPLGPLVQAADGALYGVVRNTHLPEVRGGYIYRLQLDGQIGVLHTFEASRSGQEGYYPRGGLALGRDGALYGATDSGGPKFYGTVYGIALDGSFTMLYGFGERRGGKSPAGVTPMVGNRFAGITSSGGKTGWAGDGTLFLLEPLERARTTPAGQPAHAATRSETSR